MAFYLLIGVLVVLACIFSNRLSQKFGVPTLLAFIVLGMLFGSDGLLKIPFEDYEFANLICSAALILIMFYGGFGTNWKEARPVAVKAAVLSSLGVVLTAVLTGLFCTYVLHFPLWEGMLVGAILGSTDAASVFSILRSKRLNLKDGTASLLEVESGSNDPFAYMMTVIILSVMNNGSLSGWEVARLIAFQVLVGAALGVGIGLAALWAMRRFSFSTDGFDAIFVFAVAVLAYAAPAALGGNGYLSTYLVGLILGNRPLPRKKGLVHFFDGVTGLMQMLIFFLLGLLSFPSRLPAVLPSAVLIALFLTLVARPASVLVLLTPFRSPLRQQALVSWAGLRGAASIVFAIMAVTSSVSLTNDIFNIVFSVVLLSMAVQGSLLPAMARGLKMIGQEEDVLRTFNDYAEETSVQFVRQPITQGHMWQGKRVADLHLPPHLLLAMVLRGKETCIPHGDTVLQEGDVAVLCAEGFEDEEHMGLYEQTVDKRHPWRDRAIRDLSLPDGELIVLIRRGKDTVIPSGEEVLRQDDVLVLNRVNRE